MRSRSTHGHAPSRSLCAQPSRRGGAAIAAAAVVALSGLTYLSITLWAPDAPLGRDAGRPNDPSSSSSSSALPAASSPGLIVSRWTAPVLMARVREAENRELARALSLVGITPRTLAAAGVEVGAVPGVITGAREHLAEHGAALWAALESARTATGQSAAAERKVVSGTASQQERSAADAARSGLAAALSAKSAALEGLYSAATASLAPEPRAVLTTLRANRGWDLDLAYLSSERTQEQWVALRDAVSHVTTAAKLGEEADPAMAAIVTSAGQEGAASGVSSNLANSLVGVASAWDQSLAH